MISAKINHQLGFQGWSFKGHCHISNIKNGSLLSYMYIALHSVQSTLGMLQLGSVGACLQESFENVPSWHWIWFKDYKVVKLILGGYNHPIHPHWTTPCAWSRGVVGAKILKGITLFVSYKSTETHYFYTSISFLGFPDMVLKRGHLTPMILPCMNLPLQMTMHLQRQYIRSCWHWIKCRLRHVINSCDLVRSGFFLIIHINQLAQKLVLNMHFKVKPCSLLVCLVARTTY